MANIAFGQQLLAGVFDPNPDPAILPRNLVGVGIYNTSAAIFAAFSLPPQCVTSSTIYILYIALLAFIAVFGVAMVLIGWMVSDEPDRYASLGRITLRVSQIVLAFAISLHGFASTSTTQQANAPTK